ncbi:MAG: leucine-rich repeat domain-containing protein [Acutalibacteraceae bacterium]
MWKSFKKSISVLLCVIFALSALSVCSSAAGVLTYSVDEFGHAVLDSCSTSYYGVVNVPAKVTIDSKTYEVKTIGDEAFMNCEGVTAIKIAEGVTSIGNRAFKNCTSLTEIDIPSTLISCQYDAFDGCEKVTVNCYKSNYQFFTVYGFSDNLVINVVDGELDEQKTQTANSIIDLIKAILEKIIAFFRNLVKK